MYVLTFLLLLPFFLASTDIVTTLRAQQDQFRQVSISCPSVGAEVVSTNNPIGQTFKPVVGTITTIAVYLESRWGSPAPFTVTLHEGSINGPSLLSKTMTIGPGSKAWFFVNSSSLIEVDPGSTYVIEVRAGFGNIVWHMCDGAYEDGRRIKAGSPVSDTLDFMIRVYGLVPDVALSVDPDTMVVRQGEAAQATLLVESLQGFEGDVQLSMTAASPSPGVSLSALTVHLESGGTAQATVNIQVPEDLDPSNYTITLGAAISGPWGSRSKTVNLMVQVEESPRDFSVSLSPISARVQRGGSVTFTVDVGKIGNFDAPVNLKVTGLGSGFQYSFSQNSLNPPYTSILRITTSPNVPLSTLQFTVIAEGADKVHNVTGTLEVGEEPGFIISLDKSEIAVVQGGSGTFTVSVNGYGGFTQPVTLTLSNLCNGCSASFSANGMPPSYQSVVTISVGDSTPPGNYTLGVTASGGDLTRSGTIRLVIGKGERGGTSTYTSASTTETMTGTSTAETTRTTQLSLSVSPSSLSLRIGESGSIAVMVTGAEGTVTLQVSGLPPDAEYSFNPPLIEGTGASSLLIKAGNTVGSFTGVITAKSGGTAGTTTFQLTIQEREGGFEIPLIPVAGAAAVLVVALLVLVLARRRRRVFRS